MQYLIRHSVFETNSSSTHSLQVYNNTTLKDAKELVDERIREAYKTEYDSHNYFDESDYIRNNSLILQGFDMESGDEDHNVYYLISNWMAKLQYVAMFIDTYAYYFDDYNQEEDKNRHYSDSKLDLIKNTQIYNYFIDFAKKEVEKHDIKITDIVYNMSYSTYIECIEGCNDPLHDEGAKYNYQLKITLDKFKTFIETIMKDECIITYCDEAYSPYNKPEIITI